MQSVINPNGIRCDLDREFYFFSNLSPEAILDDSHDFLHDLFGISLSLGDFILVRLTLFLVLFFKLFDLFLKVKNSRFEFEDLIFYQQ